MATKIWFDDELVTGKYDCYLKSYSIDAPDVRTMTEEVAGLDGVVDATEWLGRPIYENRDAEFEFLFMPDGGWAEVMRRVNQFRAKYHGRDVEIRTDDDINYTYSGRLSFGSIKDVKGSAQFTVDADLEPFKKMDHHYTIQPQSTAGLVMTVDFYNYSPKDVTVTITATGRSDIIHYNQDGGTSTPGYIVIQDGETKTLTFNGREYVLLKGTSAKSGTLDISWTEEIL